MKITIKQGAIPGILRTSLGVRQLCLSLHESYGDKDIEIDQACGKVIVITNGKSHNIRKHNFIMMVDRQSLDTGCDVEFNVRYTRCMKID